MKRLIIFDFYGVLGSEIAPKWFANHFDNVEEANILKDKYFEPADEGKYTHDEIIQKMADELGYKFEDIRNEMKSYAKPNWELLDEIVKLRKNNSTALLSNASEGAYELLYPEVIFDKYFDRYFLSYAYKTRKPKMEFYDLCVNSFNEQFDEIYFIDDSMKNVEILKGTKITGIHYNDNEQILEILRKFE